MSKGQWPEINHSCLLKVIHPFKELTHVLVAPISTTYLWLQAFRSQLTICCTYADLSAYTFLPHLSETIAKCSYSKLHVSNLISQSLVPDTIGFVNMELQLIIILFIFFSHTLLWTARPAQAALWVPCVRYENTLVKFHQLCHFLSFSC